MKWNILVSRAIALITCTAFVILPWNLVAPVDAHEKTSMHLYKSALASVQATPTIDATVTTLEKEKLSQEVKALTTDNSWYWWTKLSPSLTVLASILVGIGTGWFSFYRWRRERRDERKKRAEDLQLEQRKQAEEPFKGAVTA